MIPVIIAGLFLTHPMIEETTDQGIIPIPSVTLQEIQLASTRLYPEKVTGSDGVPDKALKVNAVARNSFLGGT